MIIAKIMDCRLMKCTTVPHGGVRYRTSTPHKSGNKMKEKKKKISITIVILPLLLELHN